MTSFLENKKCHSRLFLATCRTISYLLVSLLSTYSCTIDSSSSRELSTQLSTLSTQLSTLDAPLLDQLLKALLPPTTLLPSTSSTCEYHISNIIFNPSIVSYNK